MRLCNTNVHLLYKEKKVNVGSIHCNNKFHQKISAINTSIYQLDLFVLISFTVTILC